MSRCEICGSAERREVCHLAALKKGEPRKVINVLCMRCGLIFNDPAPSDEELSKYYQGGFLQDKTAAGYEEIVLSAERKKKNEGRKELRVIGFLEPLLKKDTDILDIGCSTGALLSDLHERYTGKVTGVEPDELYVRVAREFFKLPDIRHEFLDDFCSRDQGTYDLVILRHVLEHLKSPHRRIEQLKNLLTSEGALYLAFPNGARMRASRELAHSLEYGHLFTYTPWSIHHLLNSHGLKIVKWGFDDAMQLQIAATRAEAPFEAVPFNEFLEGSDSEKMFSYIKRHDRRHYMFRALRKIKSLFPLGLGGRRKAS
ncbi:MAG: class I SAM-dependent methyltransferase [Patescibacteria group bacterium]|nr:class I SAM-dependent methyltransferase [Patescibacteria group bacterium]